MVSQVWPMDISSNSALAFTPLLRDSESKTLNIVTCQGRFVYISDTYLATVLLCNGVLSSLLIPVSAFMSLKFEKSPVSIDWMTKASHFS